MSNQTYERLWREAEKEVREVVKADKDYVSQDVIEDRPLAFKQAATNYIRYSICVNKLNVCLDQIIHVQKRQTVRRLLEATMGRLLQVKQELVNQEMSDFNYLDGVLMDMRMTPYDVELKVPKYYRRERADRTIRLNQEIDQILEDLAKPPPTPPPEEEEGNEITEQSENKEQSEDADKKEHKLDTISAKQQPKTNVAINPNWPPRFKKVELTESQKMFKATIALVQKHERARIGRLETQKLKEKKRIQHDIAWLIHKPIPEETQERAALVISRFWRGYATRHLLWHRRTQGRLLMGELSPSWRAHDQEDRARTVEHQRHDKQTAADEEYLKGMAELEEAVRGQEQDEKDDIADHLRWYVENWYRTTGQLPQFPSPVKIKEPEELLGFPKDTPAEFFKRHVNMIPAAKLAGEGLPPQMLGGSALIVAGYWVSPELYELAQDAIELAKGKKGSAKKPEKKEKLTKQQLKEKKAQEKEQKRLDEEAKQKELEEKLKRGVVPNKTDLLEPLTRDLDISREKWARHHDMEWNPSQKHRDDLPRISLEHDHHNMLREVVDELVKLEIDQLQAALDRDMGKKRKGSAKKKKKKPRVKKPKKDLTHDRTSESLFKELVEKGIIKKVNADSKIDSFFCEPSWNSYDLRRDPWWQDPSPNLWDVKQVVKEYCILPLGSPTVHRAAPLVPSVLLAGYPDCGKRTLVDAVVAETGSVLFDLSPPNTVGKYPGKKGLKMLVHLVTKVAKQVQPSVIFIEGGEKPFYRKVPKAERQDNPRLLKKQLAKMVKSVTAEDQVLFLGTAETPWAATAGPLVKAYKKIIPVLPPDRGTAVSYWHHLLMRYHGVDRDFLLSPLSWCTQGYPIPTIDKVVSQVMTAERIIALRYRPLRPKEFLDELLAIPAITTEQIKKLVDWYLVTYPLAVKRAEKTSEMAEVKMKLAAIEAKNSPQKKNKKK